MSKKMKRCKVCGAEIATSAKPCPSCGAKNKKLIVLGIILLILSILLFAQMFNESIPNKIRFPMLLIRIKILQKTLLQRKLNLKLGNQLN